MASSLSRMDEGGRMQEEMNKLRASSVESRIWLDSLEAGLTAGEII
jgi:hypothetical protein